MRLSCHVQVAAIDAAFAYDEKRNQHYSTAILRRLLDTAPASARVLGVTALDLYVPVLTFVFGEAQLNGRAALISLHRLAERYYGLPDRREILLERAVKEAVHELGHTYGLRHCSDWRCVMTSSHGIERLDVKTADFCTTCARSVST
jgi:archaemetzincin